MKAPSNPSEIEAALSELIDGNTVKRSKFNLIEDDFDYSDLFKKLLTQRNFLPKSIKSVNLEIGYRIPAFYFDEKTKSVYFGWILWEKFHYLNHRKIWASELRELNGDWFLYFEEKDDVVLWVNETEIFAMEMEKLIVW